MVGKRGWLRIVEASIAVLIILSVLVIISNKNITKSNDSGNLERLGILNELSMNSSMRSLILSYNLSANEESQGNEERLIKLREYVQSVLPIGFNSSVSVCSAESACSSIVGSGDIFTEERILSANENKIASPRKVLVSYWQE